MARDIRTMNMTQGQRIESDEVMKRIGDLAYRNLGTTARVGLFDEGKALITSGLRVEPNTGMTVTIPSGACFQRFIDVIPCIQIDEQTVTMDAASGVVRVDIVEAQIKSISDKTDVAAIGTVSTGTTAGTVVITNEEIMRDIKYYLDVRKKTDSTTPTAATAGKLTGTVSISGTIDLSERYLINIADGEDGSFQEIDCRGATPEATTKAEIISAINAAVGRTIASTGAGDVVVLTGEGTGVTSQFTIKPPVTDADKDALNTIFGVSAGGVYKYTYSGTNEWFKLAEIDIGAATTTITAALIRNIDRKSTWASGETDILVHDPIYQANLSEWNEWDSTVTYDAGDVTWIEDDQYVSLQGSNLNKNPITEPNYWEIAPTFNEVVRNYQRAQITWPGIKNIDNYRDADYQQWYFGGYYKKGGKSFKAYNVHLDGTTITGDSDLEDIFDVSGSNEYFEIDRLAPDALGTRTLPDLRGRTLRAVDAAAGLTENVGTVQADAAQRIKGEVTGGVPGSRSTVGGTNSSGALEFDISGDSGWGSGSNRDIGNIYFDSADSTSPNTAKTDDDETRMANYTVGVPYITVLLEI